jgi:hypothetical protein
LRLFLLGVFHGQALSLSRRVISAFTRVFDALWRPSFVMRAIARRQNTITSSAKPVRIKENQGWACFSFFRYAVSSFRSPD